MWAKGDLMKLFSLIVMFGLICTGCGQGSTKVVETNKEQESEANTNEQNGEVTLTHRTDDDEKVLISYHNLQSGKKATDFEIKPEQCLIFKKEQIQFVTNIKMGLGANWRDRTVCSSIAGGGLHLDKFSCSVILDKNSYDIIDQNANSWASFLLADNYILKQSERNTSTACQYLEDLL